MQDNFGNTSSKIVGIIRDDAQNVSKLTQERHSCFEFSDVLFNGEHICRHLNLILGIIEYLSALADGTLDKQNVYEIYEILYRLNLLESASNSHTVLRSHSRKHHVQCPHSYIRAIMGNE